MDLPYKRDLSTVDSRQRDGMSQVKVPSKVLSHIVHYLVLLIWIKQGVLSEGSLSVVTLLQISASSHLS
jgi:hypothetical protein